MEHNIILNILEQNKSVESGLYLITTTKYLGDATVEDFLHLRPASKLEEFINARKFTDKSFQKGKLTPRKNLNKTVYRGQTTKSTEEDYSN